MAGPCASRNAADGELVPQPGNPSRPHLSSCPATSTLARSGLAFSLLVNPACGPGNGHGKWTYPIEGTSVKGPSFDGKKTPGSILGELPGR
jgi:hypothetical protein